jgi:hypothetical protein
MTSREAPTIARCDLTVRRDRFLATSCRERSISVCPLHPHFVSLIAGPSRKTKLLKMPYLRNTLLVLSSEKDSPCNATGVLALQEEGFGLAILESEDLAITTDVELALHTILSATRLLSNPIPQVLVLPAHSIIPCHLIPALVAQEDVRTFPG